MTIKKYKRRLYGLHIVYKIIFVNLAIGNIKIATRPSYQFNKNNNIAGIMRVYSQRCLLQRCLLLVATFELAVGVRVLLL